MTDSSPRVTVLLPVFNAAAYLEESVRSVLGQSFADFELLAIDDGSTDGSMNVLRSFDDPRMRIERNGVNLGLIATLNKGLDLARGEYVARMDGDDLAMPGRFEAQVALLDGDAGLGACGMFIETFGHGRPKVLRYPAGREEVRCQLLGYTPMAHPTVMFRKSLLDLHGLRYDSGFPHAEDYDLLERASHCFGLANIPEVGLRYRLHASQVSRVHNAVLKESVARIRARRMAGLLDDCDDALDMVFNTERPVSLEEAVAAKVWIETLLAENVRLGRYEQGALTAFMADRWLNLCNRVDDKGMRLWAMYNSMPCCGDSARSVFERFKLFAKCVL